MKSLKDPQRLVVVVGRWSKESKPEDPHFSEMLALELLDWDPTGKSFHCRMLDADPNIPEDNLFLQSLSNQDAAVELCNFVKASPVVTHSVAEYNIYKRWLLKFGLVFSNLVSFTLYEQAKVFYCKANRLWELPFPHWRSSARSLEQH